MQNLKVWTFHPTARNTLYFIVLSVLYLILQRSLQSSLPFLNLVFLKKTLLDEWYILLGAIPACWLVYRHRSSARLAFAFFCTLVAFRSLEALFLDFNKVLMIVLFIYVCMTYAFYQLLTWTFSRAVFSPNFRVDDLHAPMAHRIPVTLNAGEAVLRGYLTNWDTDGAFVYLECAWNDSAAEATLELVIGGEKFGAKGSVVTVAMDRMGIGLEWDEKPIREARSWSSLIELFDNLGWTPHLLR
jgi:hypothetical protein